MGPPRGTVASPPEDREEGRQSGQVRKDQAIAPLLPGEICREEAEEAGQEGNRIVDPLEWPLQRNGGHVREVM